MPMPIAMNRTALILLLALASQQALAAASSVTPTYNTPLVGGPTFDPSGDVASNADLQGDAQGYLLYGAKANGSALLTDASGNRYLAYRVVVASAFSQKFVILFNVDGAAMVGAAGFDATADIAIVVDVGTAPAVFVTGTNGTGANTRPNNTDFFLAAGTKAQFQVVDATVTKPSTGCTTCYVDAVLNFDQMLALLQDASATDGDAQVVRAPLSSFSPSTRVQYAVTTSANLNNVNKDLAGSSTNDVSLQWVELMTPPTTLDDPEIDTDGDGIQDLIEDRDNDGLVDANETNPRDADTDDDGLCDGGNSVVGICFAGEDRNNDGVRDSDETNPLDADTDDDGASDGSERGLSDPLDPDSDGDGLCDGGATLASCGAGETNPSDPCAPIRQQRVHPRRNSGTLRSRPRWVDERH
jgi:hypothetical protein